MTAFLGLLPAFLFAAYLSFLASENFPVQSAAHHAFTTSGLILFIMGGMAGLGGLITLWNAVFYRPGRTWAGGMVPRIESDVLGLKVIVDEHVIEEVSWNDVLRVIAFKRDLITVDEIYLGIAFKAEEQDGVQMLELSEEWFGFEEFGQLLPKVLPGIPERWYSRQSRPAFSEVPEVLFDRIAAV